MPAITTTGVNAPRFTKIICTISDLNCSVDFIRQLYIAGMDIVRLNTAHQSVTSTRQIIHNIRRVSADIAIMLDTKGAEMRTCGINGTLKLAEGMSITITAGREPRAGVLEFAVNAPLFVQNIPVQAIILLDEGKITLEVVDKAKGRVTCRVLRGGTLMNRRSVNVPGVDMGLPGITEQDRAYIDLAIEEEIDFIAHSFVRCKEDVLQLQELLQNAGSSARVVAKIENRDGIENLQEIMEYAWGILIARGDLGIEIPAAQVPQIQKAIIRQCRQTGKPVILATHILGSMTGKLRPTQAEISDVANAVLDGVDALTLTGETAEGVYPIETTQTLNELCRYTETWQEQNSTYRPLLPEGKPQYMQVIHKVLEAAGKKSIAAVVDKTITGLASNMLASARCGIPVLRWCSSPAERRQCVLHYGVFPFSDSGEKLVKEKFKINGNEPIIILKSAFVEARERLAVDKSTADSIVAQVI